MSGIAKFWNSVTGRPAAPRQPSAIPRALPSTRTGPSEDAPQILPDDSPNETRGADRFVPLRSGTVLTTADGKRVPARIINISRTGVAIEADLSDVRAHEIVKAGNRPVKPGRVIARGAVFLFQKPLDPKLCNPGIIL